MKGSGIQACIAETFASLDHLDTVELHKRVVEDDEETSQTKAWRYLILVLSKWEKFSQNWRNAWNADVLSLQASFNPKTLGFVF